ncbi:MAG: hypothetical protein EOO16_17810 [Chitinophagaceae bacterium]|nr:MAG: hypothetical protein EOO16_17810 [Chitinophagaceae bacterium]
MNPHRLPAFVFGMVALLLAAHLFLLPARGIDLHFHDTYFVIGNPALLGVPAVLCFIFGLLYLLLGRILLSRWLSWLHVVLTLVFIVALVYRVQPSTPPAQSQSLSALWTGSNLEWLLAGLALGQVLFIFNLFGGALRALFKRSY